MGSSKAQAKPDGLDRRISRRSLTDIRAVITWPEGGEAPCVIRDRSETGARLVFRPGLILPSRFGLAERRGPSRSVRLVWSDDRQAGVTWS